MTIPTPVQATENKKTGWFKPFLIGCTLSSAFFITAGGIFVTNIKTEMRGYDAISPAVKEYANSLVDGCSKSFFGLGSINDANCSFVESGIASKDLSKVGMLISPRQKKEVSPKKLSWFWDGSTAQASTVPLPDNHVNEAPPIPKPLPASKAYRLFNSQNFSDRFISHILTVAKNKNVDPVLVYALMKQESNFKLGAKSPVGACGAMQVMPFHFKQQAGNCSEPYLNVKYGVGILSDCLKRAGGNLTVALSLYNSGTKNGYLRFSETRNYVSKITSDYYSLKG